ncbi:MAG: O-antigen ligase family protein, partial [bacterium]|nr:O-antigen ligase family protein [bacterium]
MKTDSTTKSVAKWVALGALFLIPFTPLIVSSSYFFPFITGKAFYFRILVEIAVVAWVALATLDKAYRPRFSWVGAAVVGFVVWMFIADAFALNATKAFWSNFERMEGWVLLAHLLGLFFAMSAVLRVDLPAGKAGKKWRAWFITSLGVSLVISGYALLQMGGAFAIHQGASRIDATLGNSAYLAIYFLFSVCIALWLALTEKRAWLKWMFIALAVLETVLIFFTETRGTIIGLTIALALAAFLTALTAGKQMRRIAAGAFALLLILSGSFYLARNSSFVQNNHVLQRVASISLSDGQTRFTIWKMAFQGVLERPLTGWGQEGFNYIFNKYYDPSLYKQEPWFDRAHNAFIDWLTAGGIPAFLLYLSLFGSAILLLWKSSELSRPERIALTAALVGYAVHNLFVFDNVYSYVYFFAILALIDSQVSKPIARFEQMPELDAVDGTTYVIPIAAVVGFALFWFVNVPGMQTATKLITAISPSENVLNNLAVFEELLKNPPFAAQEVREQLVSFAAGVAQSSQVSNENKQKIASFAVSEMQKQVAAYPLDAREHNQLSFAYRIVGDNANALKEMQTALLLSPNKEQFWIEAG